MANFSINNSTGSGFGGTAQSMAATYKTFVAIAAGSSSVGSGAPSGGAASPYNARRGKIYDILIGTNGTPADNFVTFDMSRITAALSSVAFAGAVSSGSSSFVLDTADGLIQAFAVANSTLESSVGVSVWSVGINQRASYRWVAAPGSEIVYPAASSAGVALRALSAAYTGTVTGTVLFQEQ